MNKPSTERHQKPGPWRVVQAPLAPQRWGEGVGGRESFPGLGAEEQRAMGRTELAARYKNPVQWTEHPWVVRVEGYQRHHCVPSVSHRRDAETDAQSAGNACRRRHVVDT